MRASFAFVFAFAMLAAVRAAGQESRPLRIFGSNEVLVERYNVSGNRALSPFRFPGTFWTNRLELGADWTPGSARTLTVRAELFAGNNDYFAADGMALQRFFVQYENGASVVPFRVAAGDVMADVSRHTLQRNVRGVRVEIQPAFGGVDQSIVILAGNGEPSWRDTFNGGVNDLAFSAISYLTTSRSGNATVVASLLNAQQRPRAVGAIPIPLSARREQRIGGVYGEWNVRGLVVEGEVNVLQASGADDFSIYSQVARAERNGLDWRIRFEQNGENYAPIGGLGVIANRRTGEAYARYRLPAVYGWLSGRAQVIEDGFEAAVSRDIRLAGLGWDATPFRGRPTLQLRASADMNDIRAEDRSIDLLFENYVFELLDRWRLLEFGYRGALRTQHDSTATGRDTRLVDQELTTGGTYHFAVRSRAVEGSWRAGASHRRQTRSAEYTSLGPLIDASLRSGPHLLRVHLGVLQTDFDPVSAEDLRYRTSRVGYSYIVGRHTFGVEWGSEYRDPERSLYTDSRRLALRYRLAFE